MFKKKILIVAVVAFILSTVTYYFSEPWALTFIDDGPYFTVEHEGDVETLELYSKAELKRFGKPIYILESRLVHEKSPSIFVLKDTAGKILWQHETDNPPQNLGPIAFGEIHRTWNGGWRIKIQPAFQESGSLYLNIFGDLRFFNHSW